MNCREFRRHHPAYVDDTLSGEMLDGMAHHRRLCDTCAQLDTRMRRALLVARNLPTIEPSPLFTERLSARLQLERDAMAKERLARGVGHRPATSLGTYTIVAAGVLMAAGLAGAATLAATRDTHVIRLAPVVATRPDPEPSQLTTPAMVAAMPAGMPIWPAVFVAQQASWHLANDASGH